MAYWLSEKEGYLEAETETLQLRRCWKVESSQFILELVKQIKIGGESAEYKRLLYTYKGYAGSTCSETFLGKHQLKSLSLQKASRLLR